MNKLLTILGVGTVLSTGFIFLEPANAQYSRYICNRNYCFDRLTKRTYNRYNRRPVSRSYIQRRYQNWGRKPSRDQPYYCANTSARYCSRQGYRIEREYNNSIQRRIDSIVNTPF